jgi:hypothetical protein
LRKLKTKLTPELTFDEAEVLLKNLNEGDLARVKQVLAWVPEQRTAGSLKEKALIVYELHRCSNCKYEVISAMPKAAAGREWKDIPSLSVRRRLGSDASLRESFS